VISPEKQEKVSALGKGEIIHMWPIQNPGMTQEEIQPPAHVWHKISQVLDEQDNNVRQQQLHIFLKLVMIFASIALLACAAYWMA